MGNPIHTNNAIVKSIHVSRIQNTEQQKDETQRRQFALALQQEAAHKKDQVQNSHKAEAPEIDKKNEEKGKHEGRRKNARKKDSDIQDETDDGEKHIDIVTD